MNEYSVALLDTKDHVYLEYVLLAENIESAISKAKEKAYYMIWNTNIFIRYVSVQDGNEQYMYHMITKKLEKWY